MKRQSSIEQRSTVIYGILSIVLTLVVLQLWLLTATMNAFLGGDDSVIWTAAVGSGICLLLNVGLLRFVYSLERA